ncbi:MAG: dihydroorotate dehydrogenase-like protein [Elusimicrobia bacterium]|nr:dihydroorotate dehydrogenase-like protein [Elusimicrobiota bacterium]
MDLSATYMGLKLRTPLVPSSSPLCEDLDTLKKLEDAGASAVVLPSVFEEQIAADINRIYEDFERGSESFAEAVTYFPRIKDLPLGPEEYLELVAKAKAALKIPVIGSINGFTPGGWTDYARSIEQAGADAVELNTYFIPTDRRVSGAQIEQRYLETIKAVAAAVKVPVAVKLSPYFSNLANFAAQAANAGADGLVLFNRFYQPDIDLEELAVKPRITLSTSESLRLPLRWAALLHGQVEASLGITGGVHTGADALKAVFAGADAAFLCSVLLRDGVAAIKRIEAEMTGWLEEKEYASLSQGKGSLSRSKAGGPAYERALYIEAITRLAGTPIPV